MSIIYKKGGIRIHLKIIIVDSNEHYVSRLSNYLSQYSLCTFQVISLSNVNDLIAYLAHSPTDLILISQSLYQNELFKNLSKEIVLILLSQEKIDSSLLQIPCIFKYEHREKIARNIIDTYSERSELELLHKQKEPCKVIGIYSPVGGSGKTTVSVYLAKEMARKERDVLFLSMEDIPSYQKLLPVNTDKSLSDYLYYVKKQTKNLLMKLQGITQVDEQSGLKFFPPPLFAGDVLEDTAEEWVRMINFLIKSGYYQYIIIDFTSEFSKKNQHLLKLCDHVVLVMNSNSMAYEKIKEWKRQLNDEEGRVGRFFWLMNYNSSHAEQHFSGVEVDLEIPFCNLNNGNIETTDRLFMEKMTLLTERILMKNAER